jgi:hypothetical protein
MENQLKYLYVKNVLSNLRKNKYKKNRKHKAYLKWLERVADEEIETEEFYKEAEKKYADLKANENVIRKTGMDRMKSAHKSYMLLLIACGLAALTMLSIISLSQKQDFFGVVFLLFVCIVIVFLPEIEKRIRK